LSSFNWIFVFLTVGSCESVRLKVNSIFWKSSPSPYSSVSKFRSSISEAPVCLLKAWLADLLSRWSQHLPLCDPQEEQKAEEMRSCAPWGVELSSWHGDPEITEPCPALRKLLVISTERPGPSWNFTNCFWSFSKDLF
jgi:hypothetical protein